MIRTVRRWRRLRTFGTPIVVVSGLPRSGTSMMMSMLEAGGLEVVIDAVRVADESNPRGYYECARVKTLEGNVDKSWLENARGKAIKIISHLLPTLPETNNYRVIFMRRHMDEIMASQRRMVPATDASADVALEARLAAAYEEHLRTSHRLLTHRPCFEVVYLDYRDVLDQPHDHAERIKRFLKVELDVATMASRVDRELYRNRQ